MSSSSEAAAVTPPVTALPLPELRSGRWTRLHGSTVLGDAVTEQMLDGIAAQTRDAARAQGYAVGWAEGRRAAEEQAAVEARLRAEQQRADDERREAEHRRAIGALADAAAQVRAHLDGLARAVEQQAARLACALTSEIVGARLGAVTPADVVARVLDVLPPAMLGTVHLHPSVATADDVAVLVARGLNVTTDPALAPADAIVVTDDGCVTDLRVDEALARVREVLG